MTSGSEVMCRKKVNTPWSIYRVLTVLFLVYNLFILNLTAIQLMAWDLVYTQLT